MKLKYILEQWKIHIVEKIAYYKNGKYNEEYKEYFNNGKINCHGEYKNNKKIGEWNYYNE